MKLVFEGAPAVGKSTVSNVLKSNHNCQVIPEVNVLFGKECLDSHLCYYQKQVERWSLATSKPDLESISIFDGDIFQPVWFSYLFSDEDWGCFDEMNEFYLSMLQSKQISFPDKYVFFYIDENTRVVRETERSKLLGKNSEQINRKIQRYSNFSIQQYDFFYKLREYFPDLVVFIESNDISDSVDRVLSLSEPHSYKCLDIFQFILDWGKERCEQSTNC